MSSGRRRNNRQVARRQEIPHPIQLNPNITFRKKYRFLANSAPTFSTSFTNSTICGSAGGMATDSGGTLLNFLAQAVRVHSIEIWGFTTASPNTSTITLIWGTSGTPGSYDPQQLVTDSAVGTAMPAHIKTQPPKGSDQAMWLVPSGDPFMRLASPAGSIVDVDMTVVLNSNTTNATGYTVSGATQGYIYGIPLDGSSDVLRPVGLPYIT
jgi:hypothetical protein